MSRRFGMDTVHWNPNYFGTVETHRAGPLSWVINAGALTALASGIGFLVFTLLT